MRQPQPQVVALGTVLGLLTLGLYVGRGSAVGDPELHQLGAAGLGALLGEPGHPVDRTVVDGELVEAELGVLVDLGPAGWVLAGLEVDHDHAALIVELEPVGVPVEPDDLAAGEGDLRLQLRLGGDDGAGAGTLVPGDEAAQGELDDSKALPAIWENPEDFEAKHQALIEASTALQGAAGTDLAAVQASMGAVGASCGGCHETYRAPDD